MAQGETIAKCETCGEPVAFDEAIQCTNCWEVESRINCYLRSEKGRKFIHSKLCDVRYESEQENSK